MLEIDVLTIFPGLFAPFLDTAFVAAAREHARARIDIHDLRDWATDRHRSVDDSPYGGGPGMVMMVEPLVPAIEALAGEKGAGRGARVIAMSPQGARLTQRLLTELVQCPRLTLVCGRYEGIDQRVYDLAVDEEISIGDYVLSGGEVPAMVLIEGLARLLPGVLGNPASALDDSFTAAGSHPAEGSAFAEGPDSAEGSISAEGSNSAEGSIGGGLLEGPQYTRPPIYRGRSVPDILRSGDHAAIARWRRERAIERTRERRPDLLGARAASDATAKAGPDPGAERSAK